MRALVALLLPAALVGCLARDAPTPDVSAPAASSAVTSSEDAAAPPPASAPQADAATEREHADLILVGTVESIGMPKDWDPFHRWVVVARVEGVVAGAYEHPTFAFVVHSPAEAGLRSGGRYEIRAANGSGTQYRFLRAKPMP